MSAYAATADMGWRLKRWPHSLSFFANASDTPRGFSQESEAIEKNLATAQIDFAFPTTRSQFEIADRFLALETLWRQETLLSSSLADTTSSPAYQGIIEMGWVAVPLIISELKETPNHWFAALREITGANPVPPEHRGNLTLMAQDWVKWMQERGR